jgi:mycofactocin system creatininase family protein
MTTMADAEPSTAEAERGRGHLADLAWPAVAAGLGSGARWLALPIGSTEQHGPHLPLDTDTTVARHLARALAERQPEFLVAPAVAYGASGEHAGFPGTLSIGRAGLELVVVELIRSADAFAGAVVVNGHGGNTGALRAAATLLTSEGRRVLIWSPTLAGSDAHAGRTETSIMLALDPAVVHMDRAEAGNNASLSRLLPQLRESGLRSVSANGVLGDPTGASAAEGWQLLATMVDDLAERVRAWMVVG